MADQPARVRTHYTPWVPQEGSAHPIELEQLLSYLKADDPAQTNNFEKERNR